jgi:hypothetical protein
MEETDNSKHTLIENVNITNNVRNNLRSPTQILEKSTEEKLCCCCIDYDLSITEYKLFNDLKKRVIPPYDEKNPAHEYSLEQLLKKAKTILCNDKYKDDISNKSTVNTNNTNDEDSSIWRKLGFQTGNPRTDFRAGGFFSLEFMNYFANNHEKEFTNMINEDYFTYALVCIRLCYLMRVYLFLLPQDEIQINIKFQKNALASRKELKNFCYFLWDSGNLLLDMRSIVLTFIYQKFISQQNKGYKEINYLIIDAIISSAIQCLKNYLNDININQDLLSELKTKYRENFLKILK